MRKDRMCMLTMAALLLLPSLGASPEAARNGSEFLSSPPKEHSQVISGQHDEYRVTVGGLLDMDNTMTHLCNTRTIAFQNNLSLTIANTGEAPVTNPRVVVNGERRWWDLDTMVREFTAGATNEQDAIYLIWEHMRENRHHDDPLYGDAEFHDPVRWMNVYGAGLCDDAGHCGAVLFDHAGFNAANGCQPPFVRALHGHMQCEVFWDGDYQFIDIDENVFFLDRENRKPVSGDALARDHDLAKRELPYGPIKSDWSAAHKNASLFGVDDDRSGIGISGHRMDYVLRPGERIEFRWDNIGKWSWNNTKSPHRYYGNSRIVYEPRPDVLGFAQGQVAIPVSTCYTICGGSVDASFRGGNEETRYRIEIAVEGGDYVAVWEGGGASAGASASLDEALGVHGAPARRAYAVRLCAENGPEAVVEAVRVTTDITASPMALPRLRVGENTVVYSDSTEEPHAITVTHRWQECSSVTPPAPPVEPMAPRPGETVRQTHVTFAWPAVPGCDACRIRVSRREDMAYPYRPNFDLVVPANSHCVPLGGMFNPGETYYWRVRPRLACGVWGAWSPVWTFTWDGPMVPRNLSLAQEGESFVLVWEPNPNGARPVRYDVYGSDERGFSVNRESHELLALGRFPGNLVGSTADTRMAVVAPVVHLPNMNKAYYRVVAVDANGVESGPSDYAEMPRPYVFTRPVTEAVAGEPYRYQMDTIRSIGDLQHRYDAPNTAYHEREAYAFRLEQGLPWLQLDEAAGLLTGTPGADDAGEHDICVLVTVSYPDEVSPDATQGKLFQKRRTLPELQRESRHEFTLRVIPPRP